MYMQEVCSDGLGWLLKLGDVADPCNNKYVWLIFLSQHGMHQLVALSLFPHAHAQTYYLSA